MGWVKGTVAVLASVCALAQANLTNSQRCDDERNFLDRGWSQLAATDDMINDAYKKTSAASGTTNVFNCRVTWPIDSKSLPTEGMRTVVMDQQWYKDGQFNHHGYRISYYLYAQPVSGGGVTVTRRIYTFETCRSPKACKHLGIPAPSDGFYMKEQEEESNGVTPPPTGGKPGRMDASPQWTRRQRL